jgi:outer membrane protein OmpA-like peptidoglycan-associated protein
MVDYQKRVEGILKGSNMSDRTHERVPVQQNTLIGSSPKHSLLQRTCACGQHTLAGGECEECRKKREGPLQHAAISSPSVVQKVLRSPGQPLDDDTRTFMESRFEHDFSRVRVHTDMLAAESARAVNALAYTVGQDIVFHTGHYAPDTTAGRRLLAHELTHTIQQESSAGAQMTNTLQVNDPSDSYEREAETQATRVVAGQAIAPLLVQGQVGSGRLQRQADIDQAPAGLPCTLTTKVNVLPETNVFFSVGSSTLTLEEQHTLDYYFGVMGKYGAYLVRVDGYASVEGPQSLNWRLSCERAEAVKAYLVGPGTPPSPGVLPLFFSAADITTFAHGASTAFSTTRLEENRRATVTFYQSL